jgi:hypothetical protein
MPRSSRGKIPAIYNLVQDWWQSGGGVKYIAWAITVGPTATPFRGVVNATGLGKAPPDHPDQRSWISDSKNKIQFGGIKNLIKKLGGVPQIKRIEIYCTLMPCNVGNDSCLLQVPERIRAVSPFVLHPSRLSILPVEREGLVV